MTILPPAAKAGEPLNEVLTTEDPASEYKGPKYRHPNYYRSKICKARSKISFEPLKQRYRGPAPVIYRSLFARASTPPSANISCCSSSVLRARSVLRVRLGAKAMFCACVLCCCYQSSLTVLPLKRWCASVVCVQSRCRRLPSFCRYCLSAR